MIGNSLQHAGEEREQGTRTSQVWIRSCLERTQPRANDESCAAETTEGLVQTCWPHAQGTDAVQS